MRTSRLAPRALGALLLPAWALLSGCAVGPNHKPPEIQAPEVHRGEQKAAERSFAELDWWEVYRDPTLFSLVKEATERSFDLRIALARVEAARQAHRAAAWALAPTLGIKGGVGDAVGLSSVPSVYPGTEFNGHYGASGVASWEPDVWGRLRRIKSGARFELEAVEEDRRGVYITLVGDVAEFYFTLARVDAQKQYAARAVATRKETLELFTSRASGGVGNELEVARARASLRQAEGSVAQLDLALANAENALSLLLARLPGPIERRAALDALELTPEIPAGLPSTLLRRRPDVRAAERRLLAANEQIGAKVAEYFPKFELTGYLGVTSPDLAEAQAVRGGAALFNWTLPFLGGERIRAEHQAAIANWEGATASYERAALNSFREVADALAAVETLAVRRAAIVEEAAALEQAERLAVDRYRGGVANYLDVLTAQEQLLGVQLNLADVKARQLSAVARLYRVLGGGWPVPEEDEEDTAANEKAAKDKAAGGKAADDTAAKDAAADDEPAEVAPSAAPSSAD
jgi:multidrug efflux system outer membrane protein